MSYRAALPDPDADTQEMMKRILSLDDEAFGALAGRGIIAVNCDAARL